MTRHGLFLAVAAILLAGCVAVAPFAGEDNWLIIADVPPFQEQTRRDDCAGVALASLLGHNGISATPADIDAAVYDPRLGGALLADVEQFAARAGAHPRSGRGGEAELRALLRAGRPVLVPLDLGWWLWRRPHYTVVYGASATAFLMHVRQGESLAMPGGEFERRWSAMGRLYLYLEP